MPHAVELFLDERADHQIRQIWAALDAYGVTSLGSVPQSRYRPHVTLSVFEHGNPSEVADAVRPVLATSVGLTLPLAALGFFLTEEAPAFLGVVPSSRLLAVQRAVHDAIEPLVDGIWPYYRPDALLPHCTLAVGVTDKARVLDVVTRFPAPIPARASSAHLVEIPGGYSSIQLTPA
ncbi:2'-5' RNA ligase family protein [Wangella sp. NEAU-J3]|nr:2'-5' RNA ligase family protein [Jidongwangia harbinensis]